MKFHHSFTKIYSSSITSLDSLSLLKTNFLTILTIVLTDLTLYCKHLSFAAVNLVMMVSLKLNFHALSLHSHSVAQSSSSILSSHSSISYFKLDSAELMLYLYSSEWMKKRQNYLVRHTIYRDSQRDE